MYVCQALQEQGYEVTLASDLYQPDKIEEMYGLGKVMANCYHVPIPVFSPKWIRRFMALRRLLYSRKIVRMFKDTDADLILSTQSSIFQIPGKKMYHWLYDIADLFRYGGPGPLALGGDSWYWHFYYWILRGIRSWMIGENIPPTEMFALGSKVLSDLRMNGYENVSLVYPPCQLRFHPAPKQPYVLQVARVVPQKRLELFLEIAECLPQYSFYLAGLASPLHPSYKEKLLSRAPKNVIYVEGPIRARPQLVEEAKVYLYTGIEPGIGIAFAEAVGAGCIPVAPSQGGGMDILQALGLEEFSWNSVDEAVERVQKAMNWTGLTPEGLRKKAEVFSPEHFMEEVGKLA